MECKNQILLQPNIKQHCVLVGQNACRQSSMPGDGINVWKAIIYTTLKSHGTHTFRYSKIVTNVRHNSCPFSIYLYDVKRPLDSPSSTFRAVSPVFSFFTVLKMPGKLSPDNCSWNSDMNGCADRSSPPLVFEPALLETPYLLLLLPFLCHMLARHTHNHAGYLQYHFHIFWPSSSIPILSAEMPDVPLESKHVQQWVLGERVQVAHRGWSIEADRSTIV